MLRKKVKVVIPLYTERLTDKNEKSFLHNIEVLSRYPIVLLLPNGVSADYYTSRCPKAEVVRVDEGWLGCKNGIAGYNQMMLSEEFYKLFTDTEYILICQTDVWIFRDELEQWCDRGYDYIGGPWPKRPIYNQPLIRHYLKLRRWLFGRRRRLLRQMGFNQVGNGGLSLRRVDAFIRSCGANREHIDYFKRNRGMLFNEDWYWSIVPKDIHRPKLKEALGFAFDIRPEMCYQLSEGRLPFGCHGWFKRRNYHFWQPIIEPQQ